MKLSELYVFPKDMMFNDDSDPMSLYDQKQYMLFLDFCDLMFDELIEALYDGRFTREFGILCSIFF